MIIVETLLFGIICAAIAVIQMHATRLKAKLEEGDKKLEAARKAFTTDLVSIASDHNEFAKEMVSIKRDVDELKQTINLLKINSKR